jgi:hypothetical protein
VRDLRWIGMSNGVLLGRMSGRFDVLVTADHHLYDQQNLIGLVVSILVVPTNLRPPLIALAPAIRTALDRIAVSEYAVMGHDGTVTITPF